MNRRFAKDNCVRMVKKGVDAMSDEGSRVEGVNPACSKEMAEGAYEAELPRAKPSGRSRRVIGCVARIACALVLGHVVFFLLSRTVPVVAGEVFNEVVSIGQSALFSACFISVAGVSGRRPSLELRCGSSRAACLPM